MAEPQACTTTRYRCPFCRKTGSSRKRIAEHIRSCWSNPAARGCKTCTHVIDSWDSGYLDGCSLGLPMPKNARGDDTLAVHCESWEADSG